MPHDIIDNQESQLLDRIRRELPHAQAAKFAVGYFFVSGLEAVADHLYNVEELYLLIGNTSSRETIEQMAEGYRRLAQVKEAAEAQRFATGVDQRRATEATASHLGQTVALMDQTEEAAQVVETLVRLIEEERLHVRVYTKGRLHAKAYIFDYAPSYDAQGRPLPRNKTGLAIVGSSNFTLSGVTTNTELNVLVHGDANHAALTAWFQQLWDEAQPFEAHLMRELRRSWALAEVTPYEIYLKTLYELVRDRLEETAAEDLTWRDPITAVLTEFQAQAVRQAVQMIRRYGGCFVADVVGLGKSYIGAALVKHFERHERARPLIICPAPLVEMWQHYNEAYQLNARVLSMGMLREDDEYGADWMLVDERYRYRDFVLIDESHNFRRPNSQRYRVLQSYLGTGERRVALLTATPRSKSVWDIYHQLKLFHPREITELPIDPPHLRDYFKLVETGERRLPELLSHLLIRRTRAHILRWYGFDAETDRRVDPEGFDAYRSGERRAYVRVGGRRQFFPERELETVEYSIEATYDGLYDEIRGYLGRGDGDSGALTYARYGLWRYVRPEYRDRPRYTDLERAGANLRGLMRVMLFKRFESSVHAFRETVKRLLRSHRAFLTALDAGLIAAGEEAREILYASDALEEQALLDALEAVTGRYDPEHFDVAALRRDVAHDLTVLERVAALVTPITPARDAKLQRLKRLLDRPRLRARKVLIFTQYADTAQYLYDNLAPAHAEPDIEVIYSQDKSKARIVGRFAPRANPRHPSLENFVELQTLIATDVLSEGLNLQDCDNVINYDLHWNPVRLIQRFGRIDRIGSEHEVIYGYNFLPERALEKNLGLREKLRRRIEEIHATIGEDAAILEPEEQLNVESMYAIYDRGEVGAYEETGAGDAYVDLNEALELVRQLREDHPALYTRIADLRDGVRCGYRAGREGTVVFCRAGRYQQLYLLDAEGEILSRDMPRILYLMQCEPETPALPLPEGHNERVMRVKRRFEQEVRARRAEQAHTLALTRAQQYVLAELHAYYTLVDEEVQRQLDALDGAFRQPLTRPGVRKALGQLRRERVTGADLVEALAEIYRRYGLDQVRAPRRDEEARDEALPQIVCSEGWEV